MRTRKKIILALGLLLLCGALGLSAFNIYIDNRAKQASASALGKLRPSIAEALENYDATPDYKKYPDMEMPSVEVDGYRYIGVLSFPDLELELPVITSFSDEAMYVAPTRYTGSVYTNDVVICAHNSRAHFARIVNLVLGSQFTFEDVNGNLFIYEVIDIEQMKPTDIELMLSGEWDMTLFTCTYNNQARYAVRARLIQEVSNAER